VIGLNTDVGIAAALTGVSPAKIPQTTLAALGFPTTLYSARLENIPSVKVGQRELRTGGIPTRVPVYRFGMIGQRKIEAWPSISYETVGLRYDPGPRRPHYRDAISTEVAGSHVTATSPMGNQVSGATLRRVRPHPEPYVIQYQIDLWGMQNDPVMLMVASVLEALPPRGGISVLWADGAPQFLQLNLVTSLNVDDPEPQLTGEQQRGWHWSMTYDIETWMDNTLATVLHRTITDPTFNFTKQ